MKEGAVQFPGEEHWQPFRKGIGDSIEMEEHEQLFCGLFPPRRSRGRASWRCSGSSSGRAASRASSTTPRCSPAGTGRGTSGTRANQRARTDAASRCAAGMEGSARRARQARRGCSHGLRRLGHPPYDATRACATACDGIVSEATQTLRPRCLAERAITQNPHHAFARGPGALLILDCVRIWHML